VEGAVQAPAKDILRAAGLKPGDPAMPEALLAARERALLFLHGQGYLEAEVRLERGTRVGAEVRMLVREATATGRETPGWKDWRNSPIRWSNGKLTYRPGEPFDRRRLFDTRRRLFLTVCSRTSASTLPPRRPRRRTWRSA